MNDNMKYRLAMSFARGIGGAISSCVWIALLYLIVCVCSYYIDRHLDNSSVSRTEDGKPVYILCSTNCCESWQFVQLSGASFKRVAELVDVTNQTKKVANESKR